MSKINRIVLTGGPCAGKTTAVKGIAEHYESQGYKVFVVPEIPTMMISAGMDYLTSNRDFFLQGELSTLQLQLMFEDHIMKLAHTQSEPTIVICDRGALDIAAYMTEADWVTTIKSQGIPSSEHLHDRYDAVIHLSSTAEGAEEFYTTATNAQRLETADEAGMAVARMLNKRVHDSWKSHPRFFVVKNRAHFEEKFSEVLMHIDNILSH